MKARPSGLYPPPGGKNILGLRKQPNVCIVCVMDLYHADIRLPDGFSLPADRVSLRWGVHADKARTDDRYATIPKFDTIPLAAFNVVEVGLEGRKVAKVVVRGHWTKDLDVVFVLIPGREWFVKTVWINERTDSHGTLDRSRYVC